MTYPTPSSAEFLCADLVNLIVEERKVLIGNLETISPHACTINLEMQVAPGARVEMQCLECAAGKDAGHTCQLSGVVAAQEDAFSLGWIITVDFIGRDWRQELWQPRHLIQVNTLANAASPGAGLTMTVNETSNPA